MLSEKAFHAPTHLVSTYPQSLKHLCSLAILFLQKAKQQMLSTNIVMIATLSLPVSMLQHLESVLVELFKPALSILIVHTVYSLSDHSQTRVLDPHLRATHTLN